MKNGLSVLYCLVLLRYSSPIACHCSVVKSLTPSGKFLFPEECLRLTELIVLGKSFNSKVPSI